MRIARDLHHVLEIVPLGEPGAQEHTTHVDVVGDVGSLHRTQVGPEVALEDLDSHRRLLLPDALEGIESLKHCPGGAACRPDLARVAVVLVDDPSSSRRDPPRHLVHVAMQRGSTADRGPHGRLVATDPPWIQVSEPTREAVRCLPGPFGRYALVEQHTEQECERIVDDQVVGSRISREAGRLLGGHRRLGGSEVQQRRDNTRKGQGEAAKTAHENALELFRAQAEQQATIRKEEAAQRLAESSLEDRRQTYVRLLHTVGNRQEMVKPTEEAKARARDTQARMDAGEDVPGAQAILEEVNEARRRMEQLSDEVVESLTMVFVVAPLPVADAALTLLDWARHEATDEYAPWQKFLDVARIDLGVPAMQSIRDAHAAAAATNGQSKSGESEVT